MRALRFRSRWIPALCGAGVLAWLAGCGGGGPDPDPQEAVHFTGFSFQIGQDAPITIPPFENLQSVPPTPGAPLDMKLIFNFDGVPQGPFTQQNLPVFTTPAAVTPDAFPPAGLAVIPAKGSYVLVGNTVEFRPFIPIQPLSVKLSSPPESVPGFLPGSVYTAQVITTPGLKIVNLAGVGGTVDFGTTSNPAAYFSSGDSDGEPPLVVIVAPADGTTDFSPAPYSNFAPGAPVPSFPDGPSTFTLTFDHPLLPTGENLLGADLDADGNIDPNFFLRARGTRLLVAHSVPPVSSVGAFEASFPALSGLVQGQSVSPTGGDIFLHNSQGAGALPGADAALVSAPVSLAVAADPSLLFVVFTVEAGNDQLSVVDHVLGDPSFALIASAPAVDSQLDELVGLTTLLDGRLVGYDVTTRRLYELVPTIVRDRPEPGDPTPGKPVITELLLGTGVAGEGFMSDVFPAGIDVIDLAQAPSGRLFALADTGGAFPVIVELNAIDFDLDDSFGATDGLPAGGGPLLSLTDACSAIEFIGSDELLVLNRSEDTIDIFSLSQGKLGTAVSEVAAFGVPLAALPDGLSPATSLALGFLALDVDVSLQSNDTTGAVVNLDPSGVLPIGETVEVMQRHSLSTLAGVSLANADSGNLLNVLGAVRVLGVTTSEPINLVGPCGAPDPDGRVNDVFHEEFTDKEFEDSNPPTLSPLAEWAKPLNGAVTSGNLRASVGSAQTAQLGDFLPLAKANFDPAKAYAQDAAIAAQANFNFIFLDTDAQNFPLPNGATPGITTQSQVVGGNFAFRDFIIPEGVWVIARGTKPLVVTATGRVEISGVLDVSGSNGIGDDSFESGFTPVPGGIGGPGGGRGGQGHPTVFNPLGSGQIHQYATPCTGQRGFGPVIKPTGVTFENVGGFGGISTLGYTPDDLGYPDLLTPTMPGQGSNTEHSRPPGGGGGSYYFHGMPSHQGTGSYRVDSFTDPKTGTLVNKHNPFAACPTDDKIHDAVYGNEERLLQGLSPDWKLQCVYMQGTPEDPELFQPASMWGNPLFKDGNPDNDFIGPDGELATLVGGQGGGGGGTRIDSMVHRIWAADQLGSPAQPFPAFYPALFIGSYFSPTLYDAKGGGGGGGGGSVLIRSFSDIVLTRTGHIDASGGNGAGGETITSSNFSGSGGGGSGGAIILQAAGDVRMEADADHRVAYFMDVSGAQGASLDVSGGFGDDAVTSPADLPTTLPADKFEFTRSDSGQGGFGLIQLQVGSASNEPIIEQGAFLFARQRAVLKLGGWTDPLDAGQQAEHPSWLPQVMNPPTNELRYIDMLDYRYFKYDPSPLANKQERFFLLNGADPPIISVDNPADIGPYQLDTPMMDYFGKRVVKEPEPQKVMKTYAGWNPTTFVEANLALTPPQPSIPPGEVYQASDVIPFSVYLKAPDGTPLKEVVDGVEQFDPDYLVDRLPVVHPSKTPPPLGTVSRGTSLWLDFNGAALRARDALGVPPPLFADGVNGTYNALQGLIPAGKDGQVILGNPANSQAHHVANTGLGPFEPGLCTSGSTKPPFNDIKVDAPDIDSPLENAISDNASVSLFFQGAYPVRAGSHVPDPETLTEWVSDLRELSGFPLVRFQVTFDLAKNQVQYPFNANSFRPAVDNVRLRTQY